MCISSTTQVGEVPIYEAIFVIVSGIASQSSVEREGIRLLCLAKMRA
jgi:hypothetical protein